MYGENTIAHASPKKWCGREDLNLQGVSPTTTSTLRVYHFATTAQAEQHTQRRGKLQQLAGALAAKRPRLLHKNGFDIGVNVGTRRQIDIRIAAEFIPGFTADGWGGGHGCTRGPHNTARGELR